MKPVDIGPADLETVRRVLREHVPGLEVWAFGSRVSWTARGTSDLDIALMTTEQLDAMRLAEMREAFVQSDLPFRVDIVDWSSTSRAFQSIIMQNCVVVQEKTTELNVGDKWRKVPLGSVAEIVGGSTPSTKVPQYFNGDIPWLTPKDLANAHTRYIFRGKRNLSQEGLDSCSAKLLPRGAVLLSTRAPVGYVAIAGTEIATNQGFHSLLFGNEVCSEFAYYWLKDNTEELERHASGSTFQEISGSALKDICIPLPPIPDQEAIAHILGTLDDKIELNWRMNKTLEEMARALFKSWFVDFDPVRAKMDGRWRSGESLPGLPAHLYDLFSDSLVDSELGEIPNGWEVKTLDQLTKLNPREPMKKGVVAPYLDMAALPTSGSSSDDAVLREFTSGTRFRNKDTLLARITPCLENGKAAFIQSLLNYAVGWGSTEFIVMRAIPPVPPEYAYLLARNPDFRAHAIQSMTGTSGRQRAQTEALAS